jgi:hypothetical protein
MSIGVSDVSGFSLGSIDGDAIYDANGRKAGAVVNGNEIWDANQHRLGIVHGDASTIQIGAAGGLLILGLAAQQKNYTHGGNDNSKKHGILAFLIGIFIVRPIGNIVLGILIAIGLTLAEGGSFDPEVNPLMVEAVPKLKFWNSLGW